jgi:hypothetical protein
MSRYRLSSPWWIMMVLFVISTPKLAGYPVDWEYKGMSYASWTRGEYPYTTKWKPQTDPSSLAVDSVWIDSTRSYPDNQSGGSLGMRIHLDTSVPELGAGEVLVDLCRYPPMSREHIPPNCPNCIVAPCTLFQIPVSIQVFCPDGIQGSDTAPNGLQLFARDTTERKFYSAWHNIEPDAWNLVTMVPDTVAAPGGVMDSFFDPHSIIIIGLKIGANDNWHGAFEGTVWMDSVDWTKDPGDAMIEYPFDNTRNSLQCLKNTRTNYVALINTWYMESYTSSVIQSNPEKTHTVDDIKRTIGLIDSLGMSVMLKPHVDVNDSTWRGKIAPSDTDAWFDSYKKFIAYHATIAQEEAVELFCIGTELVSLDTVSSNRSKWGEVIDTVKSIYHGQLTYAADWGSYSQVCFWDALDIAGIDAYFPLSNSRDPPIDSLIAGWYEYEYPKDTSICYPTPQDGAMRITKGRRDYADTLTHNWVRDIKTFHDEIDTPIIFTEIGYGSYDYAAKEPWKIYRPFELSDSLNPNVWLQARCYAAAFRVFADSSWFKGTFWWVWEPVSDAGGYCDTYHTPQNKPAEDTLRRWYNIIEEDPEARTMGFGLFQNFPNPFSESTTIKYQLPSRGKISLKIYDVAGKLVNTLVDREQTAGDYSVRWYGRDDQDRELPSGVYFCRLRAGDFASFEKIVLVK